ncbi:MAG: hypothetical protein LBS33_04590 [Streptococcaceae bacterium]|jgi:Rgg/GadR/MutR family transcriptional activator|nr:hypothetical protein [Streptococcaceae bacterium]
MNHLGPAFRRIRKAKNITLKEATEGIISLPFASKWERGLYRITAAKLVGLLERLATTFDELMLVHRQHDFSFDNQRFFEKVNKYVNARDISSLYGLIKKEELKTNVINPHMKKQRIIILKQHINQMTGINFDKREIGLITGYLEKVGSWGIYELSLYANSIFMLSTETVTKLSLLAHKNGLSYQELPKVSEEICNVASKTVVHFLKRDLLEEAITTINITQKFLEDKKLFYEKNRFSFLEGIYLFKAGKQKTGLKKTANAIYYLCEMEMPEQATSYKNTLVKTLNDLFSEEQVSKIVKELEAYLEALRNLTAAS